jgi:hypothetical protein
LLALVIGSLFPELVLLAAPDPQIAEDLRRSRPASNRAASSRPTAGRNDPRRGASDEAA